MKLLPALLMGEFCGLKTVGECLFNVDRHCMSMFPYKDIGDEMTELKREFVESGLSVDMDSTEAVETLVAKRENERGSACCGGSNVTAKRQTEHFNYGEVLLKAEVMTAHCSSCDMTYVTEEGERDREDAIYFHKQTLNPPADYEEDIFDAKL